MGSFASAPEGQFPLLLELRSAPDVEQPVDSAVQRIRALEN